MISLKHSMPQHSSSVFRTCTTIPNAFVRMLSKLASSDHLLQTCQVTFETRTRCNNPASIRICSMATRYTKNRSRLQLLSLTSVRRSRILPIVIFFDICPITSLRCGVSSDRTARAYCSSARSPASYTLGESEMRHLRMDSVTMRARGAALGPAPGASQRSWKPFAATK